MVHGVQEFDRNQHLVAGLGLVEEHDGFEIIAQRDTPPVEVENLGHRPVGGRGKRKPNPRPGQIVAMQVLRNLDPAAEPHCLLRKGRARFHHLPRRIVKLRGFAMGQITGVNPPLVGWEPVQFTQPRHSGLRTRMQRLDDLRCLFCSLRTSLRPPTNSCRNQTERNCRQARTPATPFANDAQQISH
ncbi:hypothetical protein SBA1_180034 [Candidatus Sulfotelmatobacter kueseliae]|uniref:Uncharacterized protein n=1 Tax=Candidatus Sulfotelmatobacter kueseliae TaxID=2042962 RepID=A0A2U3KCM9_9BACT|nr:hypothetical protein SBA1_180034 [Candidatus Sulfotelmatobacter kueseliae]